MSTTPYTSLEKIPISLLNIAKKLWSMRTRLHHSTSHNVQTFDKFVVAFYLLIQRRDRDRAAARALKIAENADAMAAPAANGHAGCCPDYPALKRCLHLAHAAYAKSEDQLREHLGICEDGSESCLHRFRSKSRPFFPAFYIYFDASMQAVVLAVRGSAALADHVTNLTYGNTPGLKEYGHKGIVKAAENLFDEIAADLCKFLDSIRPKNGLYLVGHSLGAAVATLLTIKIRRRMLETQRTLRKANLESSGIAQVKRDGRRALCYAFSAPPCVSPELSREARREGVVTIVLGLDMVPRVSAASVEDLLSEVLRYDWKSDIRSDADNCLRNKLKEMMGEDSCCIVRKAVLRAVNSRAFGTALVNIAPKARCADAAMAGMYHVLRSRGMPRVPRIAMSATAGVVSGLATVVTEAEGIVRKRLWKKQSDFGQNEEALQEDEGPSRQKAAPLILAGRVLHVDIPFTELTRAARRNGNSMPVPEIVERLPEYFQKFDPSMWMLRDHNCDRIKIALARTC